LVNATDQGDHIPVQQWLRTTLSLLHCTHHEKFNDCFLYTFGTTAGLKLNVPLATAFGDATIIIVQVYSAILTAVMPWRYYLIHTLSIVAAICGPTALPALVYDLLRVLTLHVTMVST
jgi:N-acetylglucosaminyl transferase component (Gpi1)